MQFPMISNDVLTTLKSFMTINYTGMKAHYDNNVSLSLDELRHKFTNYDEARHSLIPNYADQEAGLESSITLLCCVSKLLFNEQIAANLIRYRNQEVSRLTTRSQNRFDELDARCTALELEVDCLRDQNRSLAYDVKKLQDDSLLEEVLEESSKYSQLAQELKEENEFLKLQVDELTLELQETKVKLEETTVKLEETTVKLEETTAELKETKVKLEETTAELNIVKAENVELRKELTIMTSEVDVLKQSVQELYGMVGELVRVNKEKDSFEPDVITQPVHSSEEAEAQLHKCNQIFKNAVILGLDIRRHSDTNLEASWLHSCQALYFYLRYLSQWIEVQYELNLLDGILHTDRAQLLLIT